MGTFCLITGASGGIGREFARVFAKNGHDMILVARSRDKLDALCGELKMAYGVDAVPFCADLTSYAEIQSLYDWAKHNGRQVDHLVNNAGFGDMGAFLDADWSRQQALLDLNISAVVRLTYLFGKDMKERGSHPLGDNCSMIDYKDIGARIRAVRLQRTLTPEQLAEAVGVGVTHISHIETGNSVPSLQVMVDIINALECSADELLCIEINQARPLFNNWLGELVSDCDADEVKLITDMVVSLKTSLRRLKNTRQ